MLVDNHLPDDAYAAALTAVDGIGSRTLCALSDHFPAAAAVWQADYQQLAQIIPERFARLLDQQRHIVSPEKIWNQVTSLGLVIIRLNDPTYPPLLKEITDPPFLLYVRGDAALLSLPRCAVVGTRRSTSYGAAVIERLIPTIAKRGRTIVSGLALGIDSLAHQTALRHGKTIAVLAHGLDRVHPVTHTALAEAIVAGGGALVSEYPPGIEPARGRFPQRNRIIAGLSKQTLVIEAPERSGALITAHLALDENREVLAVPGSILNETSAGTNRLIHDGATVVRTADDVIGKAAEKQEITEEKAVSLLGQQIIKSLGSGPLHIDNIAATCNLDPSAVGAELAYLELAGIVTHLGSQRYQRNT